MIGCSITKRPLTRRSLRRSSGERSTTNRYRISSGSDKRGIRPEYLNLLNLDCGKFKLSPVTEL